MAELTDKDIAFIKKLREARENGVINRRQALGLLAGIGVGGAAGYAGVGQASADASTSDSDGNVGTPSDRVDVFADGMDSKSVKTGKHQTVEQLSNNDDALSNVDSYLNSLTDNELVHILPGKHSVSEIALTANNVKIIWDGTLQPDGDHTVLNWNVGGGQGMIISRTTGDCVDTTNQGTYTNNAVNFHDEFHIEGSFGVTSTGPRAVNIEQTSGDNLNHSTGTFRCDGDGDTGKYGVVIDNTSGSSNNLNGMFIRVVNARKFSGAGIVANAGQVNRYEFVAGANGGQGVVVSEGKGGDFDASTTHKGIDLWTRSDGNNGSADVYSSSVGFNSPIEGSPNGGAADVPIFDGAGVSYSDNDGITDAWTLSNPAASSRFDEGVAMAFDADGSGVDGRISATADGKIRFQDVSAKWVIEDELKIRQATSGRLTFESDDLTSRVGIADGELAKHDGTGTPGEGFYEYDQSGTQWHGIGRVSGTTI
jgi:hypothetical protein